MEMVWGHNILYNRKEAVYSSCPGAHRQKGKRRLIRQKGSGLEGCQPRSEEPTVCLLDISIAKNGRVCKSGRYTRYAKLPIMTICPICKTKLIPVVHILDKNTMDLEDKGLVIIGSEKEINSYCPLCEEAYRDFTESPEI